ncbi:hypothetical protein [Paraburkholderia panacisoli]|nr:hypothetical protein [Paraburkholderia panacisoli]
MAVGNAAAALTSQQDAPNKAQADQQAVADANVDAELQQLSALRKD